MRRAEDVVLGYSRRMSFLIKRFMMRLWSLIAHARNGAKRRQDFLIFFLGRLHAPTVDRNLLVDWVGIGLVDGDARRDPGIEHVFSGFIRIQQGVD